MFFKITSKNAVRNFVKLGNNKYEPFNIRLAASQLTSLVLSTALVLTPLAYPQVAAANPNNLVWERIARTEPLPDQTENESDLAIDPLAVMLADYATNLPTVDDLAARFGSDAEAAFTYVRDQIRTEPYAGTLRSPASVIAASGGNLQDKSELLMVLLRKMGHDARIAKAPMTDTISEQLRGETCAVPLTADNNIPELLSLSPAATQKAIARAQRDYGFLLDASLDDIDASSAFSTQFGSTYFWVQYRSPDGWQDLDPSMRSATAGVTFTVPTALSEGAENPHMVTITVVSESLSDGKLREKTVLSQEIVARDAYEMPIQLGFIPAGAGLGGILADKFGDVIDLAPRIKPVLILNWEVEIGGDFAQPGPNASGGLTGSESEDPVTAVWFDISSIAPEGETRTARRAVIDLLSFDVRQSGTITPDAIQLPNMGQRYAEEVEGVRQVIISNGGLDPAQVADRTAFVINSWAEISPKLADGSIRPEVVTWMIWSKVHGIAVGAERATRDLRSQDGTICAFSGHANVMTWGLAPDGADLLTTTIDWTIDGIDLTSAQAAPNPQEAAAMRLWYGALRSAIETEALVPEAALNGDIAASVVSASTLLTGPLDRLTPEAVAALGVRSAQEDLDAGYILLGSLETKTAMPAWWRIDPASGATDARLADFGNNSRGIIPDVYNYVGAKTGQKTFRADSYVRMKPTPHVSFPSGGGGKTEYLTTLQISMLVVTGAAITGFLIYQMYLR